MTQWNQPSHERLDEKHQDFICAKEIIFRHLEGPGQSVGLQEMVITQEGSIRIFRSSWVIELEEAFEKKYGQEKGQKVFNRVITQLLINAEPVH